MQLREMQAAFLQAVLHDNEAPLTAEIAGDGISASGRLDIHRANLFASLIEVLDAAFPVTAALTGEKAFRTAAVRFIREYPPKCAQLSGYGEGFAEFLAETQVARDAPVLSDVVRLEWARNEAYFAADADPLSQAALASVPVEHYGDIVFMPHPSVRLLSSPHPILRIWRDRVLPAGATDGCAVLVLRPAHEVELHEISAGEHALLGAIVDGASLEAAAGAAAAIEPDIDLRSVLAAQFGRGTFTALVYD